MGVFLSDKSRVYRDGRLFVGLILFFNVSRSMFHDFLGTTVAASAARCSTKEDVVRHAARFCLIPFVITRTSRESLIIAPSLRPSEFPLKNITVITVIIIVGVIIIIIKNIFCLFIVMIIITDKYVIIRE